MEKEKKEIGIEKLIELLNEYGTQEEIKWKWYFVPNHIQWEGCDNSECSDLLIISKKFGFIKRLVENDRIHKKAQVIKDVETWGNEIKDVICYDEYESLLMLLSISNSPIEDLLLYLK